MNPINADFTNEYTLIKQFNQKLNQYLTNQDERSPLTIEFNRKIRQALGFKNFYDVRDDILRERNELEHLLRHNLLFRLLFFGEFDLIKLYFYPDDDDLEERWENFRLPLYETGQKAQYIKPTALDNMEVNRFAAMLAFMLEVYTTNKQVKLLILQGQYQTVMIAYYAQRSQIYSTYRENTLLYLSALLKDAAISAELKAELQAVYDDVLEQEQAFQARPKELTFEQQAEYHQVDEAQHTLLSKQLKAIIARNPSVKALKSGFNQCEQQFTTEMKATEEQFRPLIQALEKEIHMLIQAINHDTATELTKINDVVGKIAEKLLNAEQQHQVSELLGQLEQHSKSFKQGNALKLSDYTQTLGHLLDTVQNIPQLGTLIPQLRTIHRQMNIDRQAEVFQKMNEHPVEFKLPAAKPSPTTEKQVLARQTIEAVKNEQKQRVETTEQEVEYDVDDDELAEQIDQNLSIFLIEADEVEDVELNHLIETVSKQITETKKISLTNLSKAQDAVKQLIGKNPETR